MSRLYSVDFGLLFLRVTVGTMMFVGHGLGKLSKIGTDAAASFPDLLGIGAVPSHFLAASAEGVGSLCIAIGLLTRGWSLALALTMLVAGLVAHSNDPFFPQFFVGVVPGVDVVLSKFKEYALLYGAVYFSLFLSGAGAYSLDHRLKARLPKHMRWLA